ncbi:glycosyltransferase family 25 protein [Pectobacterium sp. B1J-3]|uniref:glycosyltransferase family 25 protein n=1 Tax=Pectobacterium sp. B1J-3 TaxID=3385371 RepID=UPI003906360C
MKTFAINLEREKEKRDKIIYECNRLNIKVNVIKAIDGSKLNELELKKSCPSYPDNFMTKGVIGCALSHLKIYEEIIKNDIKIALILEDDVVFKIQEVNGILDVIEELDCLNSEKPNIYLLSRVHSIIKNNKIKIGDNCLYKVHEAARAHSYIINNAAARSLHKHLQPIYIEADLWGYFSKLGLANIYSLQPPITSLIENSENLSSLNQERHIIQEKRSKYIHDLLKKNNSYRIKRFFWRVFKKPFLNIEYTP